MCSLMCVVRFCWLSVVARCALFAFSPAGCVLHVVCCTLFVACCLLHVVCYIKFAGCSLLFVVCDCDLRFFYFSFFFCVCGLVFVASCCLLLGCLVICCWFCLV